MCIIMVDSCCCMAETNTTFQSNLPPIRKYIFFKWQKIFLKISQKSTAIFGGETDTVGCQARE